MSYIERIVSVDLFDEKYFYIASHIIKGDIPLVRERLVGLGMALLSESEVFTIGWLDLYNT